MSPPTLISTLVGMQFDKDCHSLSGDIMKKATRIKEVALPVFFDVKEAFGTALPRMSKPFICDGSYR